MNRTSKYKYFYLSETDDVIDFTGSVVNRHIDVFLERRGFRAFHLKYKSKKNLLHSMLRLAHITKWVMALDKKSVVLFHFPIMAKATKVLLLLLKWKKIHTIALVHDFNGIRFNDKKALAEEKKSLQHFTFAIVHNQAMHAFVSNFYNPEKIFSLWLFDYYCPSDHIPERSRSYACTIAANLNKSTYLSQLDAFFKKERLISLHIYGKGNADLKQSIRSEKAIFHGPADPDMMPITMQGSFGIVWDGDSIHTCSSSLGEYLKYNSPHKLSVYLAAGMPVIVWSESAMANWVIENNVGISINSWEEIDNRISAIDQEKYEQIKENAKKMAKKIRQGHFMNHVLDVIDKKLL